jgi:hypothetical protein
MDNDDDEGSYYGITSDVLLSNGAGGKQ